MGTILVNTTSAFSDGDQITSDSLNNLIDDAILNTTAVSAGTGLTVNGTTGVLSLDSSLTGKVLTGGSLNNAPIGASTPNTGAFTTLSASSGYTGNVTGNVTGDVTGNISGNVTGGTGSFTTLTASGDVTFDTDTLKVDSTNNRVGIGTASPPNKLSVSEASTDFAALITNSISSGNGLKINAGDNSGDRVIELNDKDGNALMRVGATGLVGIGTASPSKLLHVKSPNSDTAEAVAGFGNGDIDVGLEIKTNGNGGSSLDWGFNAVNSRHLVFDTNQTERMRIRSDGNVGINTDPSYKLDVNGDIRATGSIIGSLTGNVTGNASTATALQTARTIAGVSFDGTSNISLDTDDIAEGSNEYFTTARARSSISASGDISYNSSTGVISFSSATAPVTSVNGQTGAVVIDTFSTLTATGNVTFGAGTGNTSQVYMNLTGTGFFPGLQNDTHGCLVEDQNANGSTLSVSRKGNHAARFARNTTDAVVAFYYTGAGGTAASTLAGDISIDSSTTVSINSASDYRIKENVITVSDGIDRLKQIPVYRFNFDHDPDTTLDGFFAHEVQSQVPEAVKGDKDAVDEDGVMVLQRIDQSKLVPLLTAALQEAVAKIEALEARVQTLEG